MVIWTPLMTNPQLKTRFSVAFADKTGDVKTMGVLTTNYRFLYTFEYIQKYYSYDYLVSPDEKCTTF